MGQYLSRYHATLTLFNRAEEMALPYVVWISSTSEKPIADNFWCPLVPQTKTGIYVFYLRGSCA
jgi:hypothetical protein